MIKTSKKFKKALFIFRRDLRLEDNIGLYFALENAQEVVLSFIFTPEQIDHNPYRSNNCLQFMIESLEDLQNAITSKGGKLFLFYGKPEEVIKELISSQNIDTVVVNRDYTPYSLKRDEKIQAITNTSQIPFYSFNDALLHPPEKTLKKDGKPYTVFTPFYHNAMQLEVSHPHTNSHKNYFSGSIAHSQENTLYHKILPKRTLSKNGGRTAALKILDKISQFSSYATLRDIPSEDATTHLSAHLKFTTISPREVYWKISKELGPSSPLIRSLFWRDFFHSIGFYFPRVFSGAFQEKYARLQWHEDEKTFIKWCEGKTGFPIVDAGMRELNQTGYMHNRVRMIVASFLTKDLHIDWRKGEKYFAQTLVDYDPSVNNGNWQWAASTGCDAQPYFRIFNPWIQALKFDPNCLYIKKWIPELTLLPAEVIHKWHLEKNHIQLGTYPKPIVDHAKESKITLSLYK